MHIKKATGKITHLKPKHPNNPLPKAPSFPLAGNHPENQTTEQLYTLEQDSSLSNTELSQAHHCLQPHNTQLRSSSPLCQAASRPLEHRTHLSLHSRAPAPTSIMSAMKLGHTKDSLRSRHAAAPIPASRLRQAKNKPKRSVTIA